ncbi:hypothetical protein NMY22_g3597 [Coprinellus aureogranulatus]|nr:hypothetical protein NMY22_g3597 [Coprinellus aureogranulatus]
MASERPGASGRSDGLKKFLYKELNFYRVHLTIFTLTPLLFSVIFYACNGRYKISFIDSYFNCVSAMMVCGLATVDLSSLTPWQQVILFIQMCIGSPVVVSWVMVFIRRRYIRTSCSRPFAEFMAKRDSDAERLSQPHDEERSSDKARSRPHTPTQRLRPDMIRRTDNRPMLINPSGLVTGETPEIQVTGATPADSTTDLPQMVARHNSTNSSDRTDEKAKVTQAIVPNLMEDSQPSSLDPSPISPSNPGFPRTLTVEFANDLPRPRLRPAPTIGEQTSSDGERASRHFPTNVSLNQFPTAHSGRSMRTHRSFQSTKHKGYGGFPMPHTIVRKLIRKAFPNFERKLTRTITMPMTHSLVSVPTGQSGERQASYIRDHLRIGRNSQFDTLSMSNEDMMDIAYLEYQALGLLLWAIALYHFGMQLCAFAIIAPYISTSRWQDTFIPPQLVRPVNSVWFSVFQAVSSYTNTGISLVDQSMLPFQRAYPMIAVMMILILAGNTCFPVFLRFFIWCINITSRRETDLERVSAFLLDHPRRCFIYLFPAHQTWFLLSVVFLLTATDWFFFLILDLRNQAIEAIPTGIRVFAGLMQCVAVRGGGFGIVPLAALSPAIKVLWAVMMYISIYPIAMSVRSTNVYEEKSLGIYHESNNKEEEELQFRHEGPQMNAWGRYLAMHARQQLAFDMWWLALSLFVVCIAESANINNPENYGWFNIFNILFELVSAYGTVGLSLGLPTANYSFSGAFGTVSKLVFCAVMIRGRHRGLPVAIDRAVMFPREFQNQDDQDQETDSDSEHEDAESRRTSARVLSIITEPVPALEPHLHRRRLHRKSQQSLALTESAGEHTANPRQPQKQVDLSQLSGRLEDIQDKSEVEVAAWRQGIVEEKSRASTETLPGEQSSNASYHRSDTSPSHREVD